MRFILISFSFDQLLVQAGQRPCLYRILCLCAARRFLSCHVSTKYRCHYLCHLEMSLLVAGVRWWARSPREAQRPRDDYRAASSARELARLVEKLSRL